MHLQISVALLHLGHFGAPPQSFVLFSIASRWLLSFPHIFKILGTGLIEVGLNTQMGFILPP